MIRLDRLGNPNNRFRPFNASKVSQDLAKVLMVGAAKLVLNDDAMIGLVDRSRQYVRAKRANPMFDCLDL